jgi:hypothetical protein
MIKVNGFQIKKLQMWNGMECTGMSGDMYHNGKLAFSFRDEGSGGGTFFDGKGYKNAETEIYKIMDKNGMICEHFKDDKSLAVDDFISLLIQTDEYFKGIKKWGRQGKYPTLFMAVGSEKQDYGRFISHHVVFGGATNEELAVGNINKQENFERHLATVRFKPTDRNLEFEI